MDYYLEQVLLLAIMVIMGFLVLVGLGSLIVFALTQLGLEGPIRSLLGI